MRDILSLHQRYMQKYEYQNALDNYENLCGEVVTRKETEEEKRKGKSRKPYKYDLKKAVDRLLKRNTNQSGD